MDQENKIEEKKVDFPEFNSLEIKEIVVTADRKAKTIQIGMIFLDNKMELSLTLKTASNLVDLLEKSMEVLSEDCDEEL